MLRVLLRLLKADLRVDCDEEEVAVEMGGKSALLI